MSTVGPEHADARGVAGVVLAAGRATRFGATKQLAEVEGRPLVLHVVDAALAADLDPVLVVVGHDEDRVRAVLPQGVVVVRNPAYAEGQATSLHVAVRAAADTDARALVVLLADQPGVEEDSIRAVVAAHAAGATVARARYDDRPGHPVLFDRATWVHLRQLDGDVGARDLLGVLGVVDVPVAGPCPPDVDVPADLPPDLSDGHG